MLFDLLLAELLADLVEGLDGLILVSNADLEKVQWAFPDLVAD